MDAKDESVEVNEKHFLQQMRCYTHRRLSVMSGEAIYAQAGFNEAIMMGILLWVRESSPC